MSRAYLLKLAEQVLKAPHQYEAKALQAAQQLIKEEKGISDVVKMNRGVAGDVMVVEKPQGPFGKVSVKGVAPVAGAMPTAAGQGNPLDVGMQGLRDLYGMYNNAKDQAISAVADRLDVRANPQQPSAKEDMQGIMHGVADAAEMFVPGAPGAAMGAADVLLQKPEGYAEGGIVMPRKNNMKHAKPGSKENPKMLATEGTVDAAPAMSDVLQQQPGLIDALSQGEAPMISTMAQPVPGEINNSAPAWDPASVMPGGVNNPASASGPNLSNGIASMGTMPSQAPAEVAMPQNVPIAMPQQHGMPVQSVQSPEMQRAQREADSIAKMDALFNKNYQAAGQELNNFIHDLKNGHIDPKRFENSRSGGEKVASAIGMILSGIGSGMTGQKNLAIEYIEKQIDRDIEAQRAEMGQKNNVFHALMQQYQNMPQAYAMLKAVKLENAARQIANDASRSKDPQVHLRAQQAIDALRGQVNPIMVDLARRQTIAQGLQAGHIQPEQAIPLMIQDHGDRTKAFEELSKIREIDNVTVEINKLMRRANEINTISNRIQNPKQSAEELAAISTGMQSMAHTLFNKTSDNEFQLIEKGFEPSLVTSPETLQRKINIFVNALNRNRHPVVLPGYNIPVPPPPSVNYQQQKTLKRK